MNNASNNVASQSGPKPRAAAQSANPAAFRTPIDSGRQSANFQRELDRVNKSDPKKDGENAESKEAASNKPTKGAIEERDSQQGGGEQEGRYLAELPSDALISAAFRAAKVTATQAATAPELPAEHLARMAAAIQEMAANGVTANYQLQLPMGSAILQGAVLGRDGAGNLAIQLIASGMLTAQQTTQLRNELMQRLEKKRLKVSSVAVTADQSDAKKEAQGQTSESRRAKA
jgi:hypothetical protein